MIVNHLEPVLTAPPKFVALSARLAAAGASWPCLPPSLCATTGRSELLPTKSQLQREGEVARRPRCLVSGWACRYTDLEDGRRQIYDVVLPGELIGSFLQPRPLALAAVAALTPVELVDASELFRPEVLESYPDLSQALNRMVVGDERRTLVQISRLGRMSALERLVHLLLQLHERLAEIGLVERGCFSLPLTQEMMGDLLGLSTVHLNRTVKYLRVQNLIKMDRGCVTLLDQRSLASIVPIRLKAVTLD